MEPRKHVPRQSGFESGHVGGLVAQESLKSGDGTGEAAGVDEVEVGQIGGEVEGDAVEGDAAADANAQGSDLGEDAHVAVGERGGFWRGGGGFSGGIVRIESRQRKRV